MSDKIAEIMASKVNKQREEIERLLQAIGLATTAVPDMVIDVANPLGMMQRVVAEVEKQRAEIKALHAALRQRDAERLIERMSPAEKMAILNRMEELERRRRAALEGKP